MTYSYTQISQYLTCPRRYRHRYLDGWQEKDTRAAMLFGRAFEQALSAYFLREDARCCSLPRMVALPKPRPCTTRRATPGIGCSNKEFNFLTDFARTIAFVFAGHAANCRLSSPGRFQETMTSSPTLTPSGSWTARAA